MIVDLDKIEVKESDGKKYLKKDGEYVVTIASYEPGTSTNTGTPYIKFECKTDSEEYINLSLYLTEKAFWRFKKFLMCLGHSGTGSIDPYEAAAHAVGRRLKISCAHRETVDPVTNQKTIGQYLEVVNFEKC